MKFQSDLRESVDSSMLGENLSENSVMRYVCINEMLIFDQSYIISMYVNNSTQSQIDLQVEEKESGDQWKSSFDATAIEKMTLKTGNFKSFDVFVNMLERAINQESSSVSLDLFTSEDLDLLRKSRQGQPTNSTTHSSNKRYLILIYDSEYDRTCYPLSLRYCGKPDPVILIQQNRQLLLENQLLKSRIQSDVERIDEQECSRVKQENNDYYKQFSFNNSKEDQQLEFLRQMIRTSEDALIKEKNKSQKTNIKKDKHYKALINQIQFLKASERQLRCKVKNLSNNITLLKHNNRHRLMVTRSVSKERPVQPKGCSSCNHQQQVPSLSRTSSGNHHRYRSSSVPKQSSSVADSRTRFNPTAYIREKNLKLRQIELEKKRETRRRLSPGRHDSNSDISISSLTLNKTDGGQRRSRSKKNSSRKRRSIDDSFYSDIERVSSPSMLHRTAPNNSTILFSPRYSHYNQQNLISPSTDNMIDIDERLKSLEKFMKQNLSRK